MTPARAKVTAAADLTGGFLKALKARGAEVGVWETRGRILSRVMAYSRDAKLSGAETHVLNNIALHLLGMGRSKGMMTVASLAADCMVEERTIRNVLRVLAAVKFITVRYRFSGQMTIMLDRRFGPRVPVPGDKSADGEGRRCAPRKKISTTGNSTVVPFPVTDECTDSAPRRESNGEGLRPGTAQRLRPEGFRITDWNAAMGWLARHDAEVIKAHDPPRKRAVPDPSG